MAPRWFTTTIAVLTIGAAVLHTALLRREQRKAAA